MRFLLLAALAVVACDRAPRVEPLALAAAGSLAAPMRAAADSFTARTGVPVVMHTAGSVELARRIVELHDVPDVIAVADEEVFPALLQPEHVGWWATFARNRVVVAMRADAPGAAEIDSTNWWRILARPGVEVGRSHPDLDPGGYRALMVLRLARRARGDSTIERAVLLNSPARDVRPKSADLVALLQTGAIDYAFVYESSARAAKLRWVPLGADIDLGDEARAAEYATVGVQIPGRTRGSTVEIRGAPVRYALSVPAAAPHAHEAMRFVDWLLSDAGRRVLRGAGLDATEPRVENPRLKAVADSAARVGTRP